MSSKHSGFLIENLRLKELILVARRNREPFEELRKHLNQQGFKDIPDFVHSPDAEKAKAAILSYLNSSGESRLLDGIGRPMEAKKSRWFLLSWLFRDAPAQRLGPLLKHLPGTSVNDRKATLLNKIRIAISPLYPDRTSWEWPCFFEVMLARLEGSRRALKGSLFENIVRQALRSCFERNYLPATVSDKEVRILEETFDIEVSIGKTRLLMPVKTRETMGGGHAMLFTRDIHKAISVATQAGHQCIPVVIAESWGGNLEKLPCEHVIYLPINPNQIEKIEEPLRDRLESLLPVFKSLE